MVFVLYKSCHTHLGSVCYVGHGTGVDRDVMRQIRECPRGSIGLVTPPPFA